MPAQGPRLGIVLDPCHCHLRKQRRFGRAVRMHMRAMREQKGPVRMPCMHACTCASKLPQHVRLGCSQGACGQCQACDGDGTCKPSSGEACTTSGNSAGVCEAGVCQVQGVLPGCLWDCMQKNKSGDLTFEGRTMECAFCQPFACRPALPAAFWTPPAHPLPAFCAPPARAAWEGRLRAPTALLASRLLPEPPPAQCVALCRVSCAIHAPSQRQFTVSLRTRPVQACPQNTTASQEGAITCASCPEGQHTTGVASTECQVRVLSAQVHEGSASAPC